MHPKNILLLRKARGDGGGHFGVRLKTFGLRPGSNRFATTPAPNLPESSEPESTSRFYLAPEVLCFDSLSPCSDMFRFVFFLD